MGHGSAFKMGSSIDGPPTVAPSPFGRSTRSTASVMRLNAVGRRLTRCHTLVPTCRLDSVARDPYDADTMHRTRGSASEWVVSETLSIWAYYFGDGSPVTL